MDPASILGVSASILGSISILGQLALLPGIRQQRPDSVIVLSFRHLQSKRIEELALELGEAESARESHKSQLIHLTAGTDEYREKNDEIEQTNRIIDVRLHDYANAIRDYETLSQESLSESDFAMPIEARSMFRELNREIRLNREKAKASTERLWMGLFGGVTLIGPMLLMVLHRGLNTSIITASVATILFALVLALGGKALAGKDVLAATAAYAAVLVVFVGTSMSPEG